MLMYQKSVDISLSLILLCANIQRRYSVTYNLLQETITILYFLAPLNETEYPGIPTKYDCLDIDINLTSNLW